MAMSLMMTASVAIGVYQAIADTWEQWNKAAAAGASFPQIRHGVETILYLRNDNIFQFLSQHRCNRTLIRLRHFHHLRHDTTHASRGFSVHHDSADALRIVIKSLF